MKMNNSAVFFLLPANALRTEYLEISSVFTLAYISNALLCVQQLLYVEAVLMLYAKLSISLTARYDLKSPSLIRSMRLLDERFVSDVTLHISSLFS